TRIGNFLLRRWNRDDQLLMFEVSSWIKSTFPCMVFLPLRDSTYDQFINKPPLDTVIKDLVFRIDPPLLEKVIYSRLNYALREIQSNKTKFTYYLPNNLKVECGRGEVAEYLKCIIASLFQDMLFKRIITGIAGRNIRKGLEILLDFCKSGHIGEDYLFKLRQSGGDYKLPSFLVARILFKGKRKYYYDRESHIKNLFYSQSTDSLPDPFVRISILRWLNNRMREFGPNRTKGYHKIQSIIKSLQGCGHARKRILLEIESLAHAGCILTETQSNEVNEEDLIRISPAGLIHLDLLKNINYLATISEDTYFRENQSAKEIADSLVGRGRFRHQSREALIHCSSILTKYMVSYSKNYFLGTTQLLTNESRESLFDIQSIDEFVDRTAKKDSNYLLIQKYENDYPPGKQVEAQIVSVQYYGFFVEFGLKGHGLIHKSNFNGFSHDVLQTLEAGDWIIAEIISFRSDRRRFELKLLKIE
ncbi:S1 RNA binding domain-containing protein, partial [Candidatus Electrothrix marina]